MELTNDFRVALPIEQAWVVLTDLERIAPCMPGAQLQEIEGDEYRGVVKVKVGPMAAQYKGQATFVELDQVRHVATLRAEGRETRGQGTASATITARLTPDGDGTAVSVATDLTVTGRVAQFGRGVLAEVSAKLLGQFAECLEHELLAGEPADGPPPAVDLAAAEASDATATDTTNDPSSTMAVKAEDSAEVAPDLGGTATGSSTSTSRSEASAKRRIDSPEPQPIDLARAAGSPLAKRAGPVLALVAVVWLLKKLFGRNKR